MKQFYLKVRDMIRSVSEDKIGIYAAQASFFAVISFVPFLSLLIAVLSLFIPSDTTAFLSEFAMSEHLAAILGAVLDSLKDMPAVSLVSVSALTALWSASKGVGAIRHGIETVYKAENKRNYFRRKFQSLINTLVFIVFIVAAAVLLLFGEFILKLLNFSRLAELLLVFRLPVLIIFVTVLFTALYMTMGRGSHLGIKPLAHMPGAVFASLGWMAFSELYGLYIQYFPRAAYIYGGLGALCLMMLWFYFCMMILLLGAEINKFIAGYKSK